MIRPLVAAVLVFLAGLLPGLRWGPDPVPWLALAALTAGLPWLAPQHGEAVARGRARAGLVLVSLAFAGIALGSGARQRAQTDCRTLLPFGDRIEVRGALSTDFVPDTARAPLLPVALTGTTVRGRASACGGEVSVRLPNGTRSLPAGSRVTVFGEWMRLGGTSSRWPTAARYAGFLGADTLAAEPPEQAGPSVAAARGRLEGHLRDLLPRHGAIVEALLLGRRERLDPEVRERFVRSGLIHLLAISGMHVGLLAGALLLGATVLRLPRRAGAVGTLALVWVYLFAIGAPPSAVRAGVMLSLGLVGRLLQRPHAVAPVIAAAALVILALDPLAALEPGFQLSFAGVCGVIAAGRWARTGLPGAVRRRRWARHGAEAVLVSSGAFLFTAPITAFHFGGIAPVAVVANLPAVPLMGLAVVATALAAVVSPLLPPVAALLADAAGVALDLLGDVALLATRVPHGFLEVHRPGPREVAAFCAAAGALALARRARAPVRVPVAAGAAAAVLLLLPAATRGTGLEIHFLDVGQGDAVALRTPAGRWVLVDAGPRTEHADAGEKRVLPFLRARGVGRIELLVLTHPHSDHIGGAPAVLRALAVGRLMEPGLPVGSPLYLETLRVAEERGVPWTAARAGRRVDVDGVKLEFLWPYDDYLDAPPDANDISAVVRVRYGEFALLLTGDVPEHVEHRLVEREGAALGAQILKLGHHGSRTSSSAELLAAVRPELGVVSAGRRNRYGHPSPEVLERLEERGIPVARTDREGTLSVRVAPDTRTWTRIVP